VEKIAQNVYMKPKQFLPKLILFSTGEKVPQNMPIVNNRPLGENSPNLVALLRALAKFSAKFSTTCFDAFLHSEFSMLARANKNRSLHFLLEICHANLSALL
jgi:hypothetical protein